MDVKLQSIPEISRLSKLPVTVSNDFLGLHARNWPTSPGGTVVNPPSPLDYSFIRTHDGKSHFWREIQSVNATTFDFSDFDLRMGEYRRLGKQVLFTLMGTPIWASSRPTEYGGSFDTLGSSAPPTNMQYWINFVEAVVKRYQDILYYEVWNEPFFITCDATAASGATILACTNGYNNTYTDIVAGQIVIGTNIAPGTKVVSRSGQNVTIDTPTTGAVSSNIEFTPYYTRTATGGTSGTTTLTVSDASGIVIGHSVQGTGIANLTKVTNIAGTTITVDKTLTGNVSGTITFSRLTFFSGTRAQLAELTRLASQVIKKYNPRAKIVSTPPSNAEQIRTFKSIFEAPCVGFVYDNIDGSGTTIKDWIDIVGTHTYSSLYFGNTLFKDIAAIRTYLTSIGISSTTEIWSTEVGWWYGTLNPLPDYNERITKTCRQILCSLFAGCSKVFSYRWDANNMSFMEDAVVVGMNNILNSVKGKTLLFAEEISVGNEVKFYFSDGTSLIV